MSTPPQPVRNAETVESAETAESADPAARAPTTGPPRRRGLAVRTWFMLAALLIVALTVTGAVVVHGLLEETARASDRLVDRIAPAQVEASRMQMAILNQETGVRGYALAGDRQFLQPYTDGLATEQASLARLRRLLADEPELRADLDAIQRAVDVWRRDYGGVVIDQVAEQGPGGEAAATAARGKPAFDEVRATWATQNRHLSQVRAESRADLRHTRTMRDWTLTGLFIALLVTAALLAMLLHYAVDRPLRMLRSASRRVADGDFTHVIGAHGPADVRDVALAVEAMRGRITMALEESTERERLLQSRTAELDAQTVELRRSNAELEQFAYVASHDLQEPLRKVASFCQMLERRCSDQLDDRGRQYIAFAVDGAKRMQVLINDLLTFSRVGRLHQHQRTLSLGEPLDQALANLDGALTEAGARVERPDDLPELTADPTLMVMLWQNLIGNAVKFRSPDRDAVVRVTCEREDGHWHLTVTDNGIGIPAEYADKIFVIFQRLHSRDAYAGTGIGLALCKKIVEYHGGRIWLDPDRGEGSRFHFTLAADALSAAPDGAEASDEAPAGGAPDGSGASAAEAAGGDVPSSTTDLQGASS
ncbi:sensor histidine kinase [Actinomadura luteofluorescens]|uniref:sensor histidine kinase n=1 Tax=Actinomadura luteofluorescens TaxID=46163 RepID=UPI0021645CCB|nr:sensor histidine kinase [Actinomadura glauciflava]MCR3741207.1 HAMP domain-containing protein [Actinomadura glauciflava]